MSRRLMTVLVEPKPMQEVEIPADATMLGLNTSGASVVLLVGVPQGSGPVRRKAWIVPAGSDITVEAQNGEFLGSVVLATPDGVPMLVVVFVETQKQAIERSHHSRGYRAPA